MIEGQQITPTLRLVRMLGRGGMGSVWIADHLSLHTQVAVKFMFVHFATNAAFVRRFQAEAQAAAAIKSPHVAQVFDHGITDEGEPFIVMELLEGEDLRARIKRGGPLSPAEFQPILTQVCKALTRAHQVGIVHRDIKPDNVFLANMGDDILIKILDFGIAKLSQEESMGATSTGSMLGTPFYMSPEQLLSSRSVDFRSDLWSLGVVAYQALTGSRPFNGETVGALSVAVNTGVYPSASSARSGLSASIDAWMQKALQRDPQARFGSAREMADEFEKAVRDPLRNADRVDFNDPARASHPPDLAGGGPMGTTGGGRMSTTGGGRLSTSSPGTNPQIGQTGPTLEGTASTGTEARKARRAPLLIGLGALVGTLVGGGVYVRLARSHVATPPGVVAGRALPSGSPGATPSSAARGTPSTPDATPPASSASAEGSPSTAPSAGPATIDLDDGDPSAAGPRRKAPLAAHVPPATKATATPTATQKKDTIGF